MRALRRVLEAYVSAPEAPIAAWTLGNLLEQSGDRAGAADAYFDALTAYRNGDPNPIIDEFSRAAFAAVRNGQHLATDLRTLHDGWVNNLRARRDAVAWRVLPFLCSHRTHRSCCRAL